MSVLPDRMAQVVNLAKKPSHTVLLGASNTPAMEREDKDAKVKVSRKTGGRPAERLRTH